jgi:hypothetical protein
MRLSKNDYIAILKYYNIDSSNMKSSIIKNKAEKILAEKLCRCIKKVDKDETKSIPICKNSVFTKKHLKISRFKCKKSAKLLSSNKNEKLIKTRKNLNV